MPSRDINSVLELQLAGWTMAVWHTESSTTAEPPTALNDAGSIHLYISAMLPTSCLLFLIVDRWIKNCLSRLGQENARLILMDNEWICSYLGLDCLWFQRRICVLSWCSHVQIPIWISYPYWSKINVEIMVGIWIVINADLKWSACIGGGLYYRAAILHPNKYECGRLPCGAKHDKV